ncbi:HK97 family phage prohead protease [Gordonia sp. CPCC 206044]|uniref:phage major capsid protein n=1 Tax=Gordonia sp. CPCC 206044 TaxID=3140793 RepID=UPI003AF3B26B
MTSIQFMPDDPTVVAEAESRTVVGLAVPFNIPGNTSGGKVSVDPGAIQIPERLNRVKLLRDHNRNAPVGYVTKIETTEEGLLVSFKVGNTPEGDVALTEAAEGIRDGLSVELSAVKRSPDGKRITSANLDAIALVAVPAFTEARVSNVTAEQADAEDDFHTNSNLASEGAEGESMSEHLEHEVATEVTIEAAAVPQGLVIPSKKAELTASEATDVINAYVRGDRSAEITAAFSDITHSSNIAVAPASWVGEVWSGVAYQRQIVPLLTNGNLTSYKVTGWRWNTKPAVAEYAGNKAAVPSNSPTTESVTVDALRLAGGHDIDRKFIDFNDDEFIASYFRAMAESYAYLSDEKAADFVIASATDVVTPAAGLLEAVAIGADQVHLATRSKATFVLVNPADRRDLLVGTSAAEVPAFLDVLGINPANWVASEHVAAGTVVVGTKPAATFYELSGSPIRVQAEHIANGGRDAALFGYYATLLNDDRGIVSVSFPSDNVA